MFKVPAYSQFLDIKRKDWQRRSCGAVALKMLLEYWGKPASTADELTKLAVRMGTYLPKVGWKHKALSQLGRSFGLNGKNYDWTKLTLTNAQQRLTAQLGKYPLIASVYRHLKPNQSGHLIVLTGFERGYVFYNDPDAKRRNLIKRKAKMGKFFAGWKKRIIVIYPKKS